MKKGGLGRGLSALIPDSGAVSDIGRITDGPETTHAEANVGEGVTSGSREPVTEGFAGDARLEAVAISDIEPNRYQPRRVFDDEKMAELTESIREIGVLQPVLVRRTEEGYELVAGERRWRAAQRAGLGTIPALVRDAGDRESLEQAIVENVHRDDLNPIEEAAAFNRLVEDFGLTQHQVSVRVGRSRPSVANALRLLHLPDGVQQMIMDGALGAGHARALAGLGDRQLVERLAIRVVDDGLSVRQVEDLVRSLDEVEDPVVEPIYDPGPIRDAGLLEVERTLGDRFDTKVRVVTRGGKGRIVVEYADREDLQRLFDLLSG
ncbi:MAG: ParB/RepB/Spo0J family partition protein [Acidimicrobiales bacterium]|jgi:ParB family chromosome partitioning protein|nr:ParB/RepB/Spo0J family partition protein [Acidimicrobiales bacterium]